MRRIITHVSFDLKFNVRDTPPSSMVRYADVDDRGVETPGQATFTGKEAQVIWSYLSQSFLNELDALITSAAARAMEPGAVTARLEAVSRANQALIASQVAKERIDIELAAATEALEQIRARTAQLQDHDLLQVQEEATEVTEVTEVDAVTVADA